MLYLLAFLATTVLGGDHVDLVTFDGAAGSSFSWKLVNDPVMGGLSNSKWTIDKSTQTAKWVGEVKIVPSLSAPGFCNAETSGFSKFSDVSEFTHLEIRARAFSQASGYKVSFAADTINPQFASFKSNFELPGDSQWHTVAIPFSDFSNDWSSFTGDCDTKDPTGRQHTCCTEETPDVCPTLKNLKDISQIGLWMEGAANKFDVEFQWVRAGYGDTCSNSEYCCPDAQLCLTPSNVSCSENNKICDGTDYPVCCPLTEICVKPGNPCTTPCADQGTYCCPDAKACLTPTNPGTFCDTEAQCGKSEICCPLTKLCVSAGDACKPGDAPAEPWWPSKLSIEQAEEPTVGDYFCSGPLQNNLRYNMGGRFNEDLFIPPARGESLVTAICCDSAYKPFAEPPGYFARPDVDFFKSVTEETTFYDPVCGIPLFTAPKNRSFADFKEDTTEHGWPSFRDEEVHKGNVITQPDGLEVVSKCGTHLGSYLPDDKGSRWCIDLSCIAGSPAK